MTRSAPDARPSSLHRRLTVALTDAAAHGDVAEALSTALAQGARGPLRLGAQDLQAAAEGFVARRAEDRAELSRRLEAAAGRLEDDRIAAATALEELQDLRSSLLEEVAWARGARPELDARRRAAADARAALDARSVALREAQSDLERVLEQRAAAAAAMEEADQELATMSTAGMDEPGLRRELEMAGRSVTAAAATLRQAQEALDAVRAEQAEVAEALAAATSCIDEASGFDEADAAQIERVLDAFEAYRDAVSPEATLVDRADPAAVELAQAWCDLEADLAEAGGAGPAPSDDQVRAAETAVAAAASHLQHVEQRIQSRTLTAEQRAAIEAAHAAVEAAEEASTRRFGGGGARARLELLRQAERDLLDQHGFATYLDVVLTGGRSVSQDFELAEAERRYLEARAALDRLTHVASSPELSYLLSERERMRQHTIELIGVDPGDAAVQLLQQHRTVAKHIVAELATALAAVGVVPVGIGLLDAAEAWLGEQRAHADERLKRDADRADATGRLHELEARAAELVALATTATRGVDEAEENLDLAHRSVEALEAELTVRAGEDTKRLKRLAATEQLRAQVESVQATLAKAEASARDELERALGAQAAADLAYDQANAAVGELARRARAIGDRLDPERRPGGDPLESLEQIAAALEDLVEDMHGSLASAEASSEAAAAAHEEALEAFQIADRAAEGPQVDDLVEGLTELLSSSQADVPLILDEPFAGLPGEARDQLLGVVLAASAEHQLVLITEEPEILGWAIELPADVGTAVPADALLTRALRQPVDQPIRLTDDHHTAERPRRHAGRN